MLLQRRHFFRRIGREAVDRNDAGLPELADALDVLFHVGEAAGHRLDVGLADIRERLAAVHLERADRRHQHRARRREAAVPAIDVEELLRAELEREPRLGHDDVGVATAPRASQ